MTVIIRKDNMVVTDSKELIDITPSNSVAMYIKQKLYRHISNKAVIAWSGAFNTASMFELVNTAINELILRLETGVDIPQDKIGYLDVVLGSGTIAVFTKNRSFIAAFPHDENQAMCKWATSPRNKPVVLGSGETYVNPRELLDPRISIEDVIETIYQYDELAGGDQYYFDLNQLEGDL